MKQCNVATGFAIVFLQCWCIAVHISPKLAPCTEPATTEQTLSDILHNVTHDPAVFKIVNLTTPTVSDKQCGTHIRDACRGGGVYYVWCKNVMDKLKKQNATVGLSFGIDDFDFWSQYLGDKMRIPTQLYDCFATNNNTTPITQFSVQYKRYDVCLGGAAETDSDGRKWETIGSYLNGRQPLSVLVKLDIEGSEWDVLPGFLDNPGEIDKVALIDLEFHFCSDQISIFKQVSMFNKLLEHFVVAGRFPSDNNDRISSYPDADKYAHNKKYDCHAPNYMPSVIAVSYINKKMIA